MADYDALIEPCMEAMYEGELPQLVAYRLSLEVHLKSSTYTPPHELTEHPGYECAKVLQACERLACTALKIDYVDYVCRILDVMEEHHRQTT